MAKLEIIHDTPNRYYFKTIDDCHIDIEHKDKQIKFKLHKWKKEASFEVSLNLVEADTHKFSGNKIEVEDQKKKLSVYPIEPRSTTDFYGDTYDQVQCHDGGLRFDIVLKEKPLVNTFNFPVKAKNLRFSYQPPGDLDEGVMRPLNVEGSYAVYHITKKNNQYMTGKAFHIYRPIAKDALGNSAWCNISLDKYIDPTSLTLTIPQQFLDEAVYPMTIDPDFGYTAIGGSWGNIAANVAAAESIRHGSAWPMPAPGGTANYMRAYLQGSTGITCDVKAFINQKDSGGAGTHGQIATDENLACAEAAHWEEFTLGGETLTQAVDYLLNVQGNSADVPIKNDNYQNAFDSDGATAVASYIDALQNYAAPENPWVDNAQGGLRDNSIFVNYTDLPPEGGGGAGAVVMGTKTLILDLLLEGVID